MYLFDGTASGAPSERVQGKKVQKREQGTEDGGANIAFASSRASLASIEFIFNKADYFLLRIAIFLFCFLFCFFLSPHPFYLSLFLSLVSSLDSMMNDDESSTQLEE